jgi:hypothetical protein
MIRLHIWIHTDVSVRRLNHVATPPVGRCWSLLTMHYSHWEDWNTLHPRITAIRHCLIYPLTLGYHESKQLKSSGQFSYSLFAKSTACITDPSDQTIYTGHGTIRCPERLLCLLETTWETADSIFKTVATFREIWQQVCHSAQRLYSNDNTLFTRNFRHTITRGLILTDKRKTTHAKLTDSTTNVASCMYRNCTKWNVNMKLFYGSIYFAAVNIRLKVFHLPITTLPFPDRPWAIPYKRHPAAHVNSGWSCAPPCFYNARVASTFIMLRDAMDKQMQWIPFEIQYEENR